MKEVQSMDVRNIAIVGHGQAGKTSLTSAILFDTGMVTRLGNVDQGNTVTDYDEEETERKISVQAAVAYAMRDKVKINLIDTPGFSNFIWEARLSLRAVESGLMVINALEGVEVQSEKLYDTMEELGKALILVVNKMKKELADFDAAMDSIAASWGKNAVAVQLPLGKGLDFTGVVDLLSMKAFQYENADKGTFKVVDIPADLADVAQSKREELVEKIAENSEALMEKYFEEGDLSDEELTEGLRRAILKRDIFPVLCSDAVANIGVHQVVDFIGKYAPSPLDAGEVAAGEGSVKPVADAALAAQVFKTISDPFTGKITIMRVYAGTFKSDSTFHNISKQADERVGSIFLLQGKNPESVDKVYAGDIVAVAKLKETQTGDTLGVKGKTALFPAYKFPISSISFAIEPKSRDDENKISNAMQRIQEEDPTVRSERDTQTKELVISGNGQMHVELVVNKLKRRYGVEVTMKPPKIPYLETIQGHADVNKKYKKQSGGRGQYGHVMIRMDPLPRGKDFVFEETIFGGSIPRNYVPAVEKGILEARVKGVLAGYPVVDFKVDLYDGSYHEVDSSDMAFKIAASMAFKMAMKEAKPTLLEPIMKVDVFVPEEFMGDINGALSGRRGRIQGMESKGKNMVVKALAPMAEMLDFDPQLTSITGGRGSYFMEFSHYDPLPHQLQKKVIDEAVKEGRVKEEEE
ncbi:MAG TPA: elongation factor G [Candidatus Aminicenantes bacterium]|nr:elongation factor G [Candidatus Aminicenantes bacterium]